MSRLWLQIVLARLTVFSAAALTCGALTGLTAVAAGLDVWACVLLGSLLPAGPLFFYFSSTKMLNRAIQSWDKMMKDKVITERQFRQLRQAAVLWYSVVWYGTSALEDNESSPAPATQTTPPANT